MRAGILFRRRLEEREPFSPGDSLMATLYGSLAYTGAGHLTDRAVVAGLCGLGPEDAAERSFLDGEVVKRVRAEVGMRWAPARDVVLNAVYRTTSHRNARLSGGLRGDFRTHRWTAGVDLHFR